MAAAFSQFAQFGHLKFTNMATSEAFLFAISLACVEYAFAIPAQRIGYLKAGVSRGQIQTIWITGMLFFYALMTKYYFKGTFTWVNLLAFALIGTGAALNYLYSPAHKVIM